MVAPSLSFKFHKKIAHFNGKKSGKRVIGFDNPHRLDPIKKNANPITRFALNFSDDPRCAPIKSYRGRTLVVGQRINKKAKIFYKETSALAILPFR